MIHVKKNKKTINDKDTDDVVAAATRQENKTNVFTETFPHTNVYTLLHFTVCVMPFLDVSCENVSNIFVISASLDDYTNASLS